MKEIKIIGAGLAGCEAAYQLAKAGFKVKLYEQKPIKRHSAFNSDNYAELICSNSLRSNDINSAIGLLKEELRILDSLIMEAADKNQVPAGKSLAVDRNNFSKYITDIINNHPNIEIIHEEVKEIDKDAYCIIASGPLCEGELFEDIKKLCGENFLYFFDAIAPIVDKSTINFDKAYYKSRYDDENIGDYINCPMNKEEYDNFYNALMEIKEKEIKEVDKEIFFEGCMPFEEMAKRGYKTLLFGPMKPVGLELNGERPYAVVQLRKDDAIDSMYNIVGFQTHLSFPDQKRIIQMIPGLEDVEIIRYGVMHRNTYINSPKVLNNIYQMKENENIFFVGQISGVEGYVESCASGLYAALSLIQILKGKEVIKLDSESMLGAMANYISDERIEKLIPMNANFGIFKSDFKGNKKDKKAYYSNQGIARIKEYKSKINE